MLRGTVLALIALVIVIIIVIRARGSESFTSVGDKVDELTEWMSAHGGGSSATYANFIEDNPDSNIVEYTKLRALYADGRVASRQSVIEELKI
jgi:Flp pilus assembly pilin Flp